MNDPPLPSDKPPRRPRYSGKNPRKFHEKYKELQPQKYARDVAKVIASGKTPAGSHRPIMVEEILNFLRPRPGEIAVDCTLGYGGHASRLLTAVQPGGLLIGLDADPAELVRTEVRLQSLNVPPESLFLKRSNFAGLPQVLAQRQIPAVDMVLADLGVSSMQIDNPDRGFTFKEDGPLDMRMNQDRGETAAQLLTRLDADMFTQLLEDFSDEPRASRLATGLIELQRRKPCETTLSLAQAIRGLLGGLSQEEIADSTRRVFQTLRIAVNDELGALDAFLRHLPWCLKSGGRVAILTFHSGEDRRVKHHFKQGLAQGVYSSISQEVIRASAEERRTNPRSTSAKLRFAVK